MVEFEQIDPVVRQLIADGYFTVDVETYEQLLARFDASSLRLFAQDANRAGPRIESIAEAFFYHLM